MKNARVLLSLGSNLGDRKGNINSALELLELSGVRLSSVSSFYETEPVGNRDQPDYLNIACIAETGLPPFDFLDLCLEIEKKGGRSGKGDMSPRRIDIDILQFGEIEVRSARLTLPHPEMARRRFVLVPLREIMPDFTHQLSGKNIKRLLEECGDRSSVRLAD